MYPLKRVKFSNEKLQAYLFVALVANLIVGFRSGVYKPSHYIVILLITFFIDIVFNFIRYKKILCSVSAGITASVVLFLMPNVPIQYVILASIVGITFGKQVWGGTGKNPVNPALLGVLLLTFITKVEQPELNIIVLLCLPFMIIRIIPVLSFLLSAYIVYLITGNWSWFTIYLAFVAVTDPVTVKNGFVSGTIIFLVNFILLYFFDNPILSVLSINVIQFLLNKVKPELFNYRFKPLKIKSLFKVKNDLNLSFDFDTNLKIDESIDLISVLEKHPINGQGGAAFPLLNKINSLKGNNKTLIINGAECDPGLFHDKYLMDNLSDLLDYTASYLQNSLNINQAYFVSKQDRAFKNIKHIKLKNFFPVGYEKTVVKEVTGDNIPLDVHPTEMGYLIINVQTLLQLYLVLTNQNANERYITLCDLDNNLAQVIKVKNGDTIGKIFEKMKIKSNRIFTGGGLMAAQPGDRDVIISDSINSIFYGKPDFYKESPQCSLCGLCMKVCPVGINPGLEEKNDQCIKCGACSYICLAGRKLSTRIN